MAAEVQNKIKRTALRLALVGLCMFGFAFALVPLYDLLCDALGINGKTEDTAYEYEAASSTIDTERLVSVEFIVNNNAGMPWKFAANTVSTSVHPGALTSVSFHVQNPTREAMAGQAVPSVAPAAAAQYFHKTECFCFEQQRLEPLEAMDMPLRFIVDKELPDYIRTITLSYTMFDVTDRL